MTQLVQTLQIASCVAHGMSNGAVHVSLMVCLMVLFMSRCAAEDTPRPSIIKSFQYANFNFVFIIL